MFHELSILIRLIACGCEGCVPIGPIGIALGDTLERTPPSSSAYRQSLTILPASWECGQLSVPVHPSLPATCAIWQA
jgi:hypothetical protein